MYKRIKLRIITVAKENLMLKKLLVSFGGIMYEGKKKYERKDYH